MASKKTNPIKIIAGVVIFLTLPTLLFFGFLYFKYHEDLPTGIQGEQADALAYKMLDALNYEAYKSTNYIEWTFKKRRYYEWDRAKNTCNVMWKQNKVALNLNNPSKSKVYIHSFNHEGEMAEKLIKKALKYFNNDSFWLVAPYKVLDKGVERRLVKTSNNKNALLVTYTSGGSTPGDSYLWLLDNNNKPTAFKMWTSLLPIDGLTATWEHWTTTQTGAQLPTFHKLLFFGLEIEDIQGTHN
ncbi:hypothetical protein [Algibacter luteus]|jgi:hypothetical protein|uniref:hypothetical protein n=1 Tax=Algibacter luteus TaxID=1178825 RepID=UPI0025927C6C|nr:hypothetical protein [Algibacter luteus]WJJ95607.1 hypothetical protein O5O44_10260 [Algibacter luteus]